MNQPNVPPRPPFNDALYEALNPLQQMMQRMQKDKMLKLKYGFHEQDPVPQMQKRGASGTEGQGINGDVY